MAIDESLVDVGEEGGEGGGVGEVSLNHLHRGGEGGLRGGARGDTKREGGRGGGGEGKELGKDELGDTTTGPNDKYS